MWFRERIWELSDAGAEHIQRVGRSIRGVGPFSDLVPADTQQLAEQAWDAVREQYGRVQSRHSWLYENQDSPLSAERDAAAGRSEAKLRSMLAWLLAWLGAGPEKAFEVLAVLTGEQDQLDVWAAEEPSGTEGPQPASGEATAGLEGVGGTSSHTDPERAESPLRASWDATGCLRLPGIPTCWDRVQELGETLGWPAVECRSRVVKENPAMDVTPRSVAAGDGWQAFLSEMISLKHPRSVDFLFFAELALIRFRNGLQLPAPPNEGQ